jgi:hypothetical protein
LAIIKRDSSSCPFCQWRGIQTSMQSWSLLGLLSLWLPRCGLGPGLSKGLKPRRHSSFGDCCFLVGMICPLIGEACHVLGVQSTAILPLDKEDTLSFRNPGTSLVDGVWDRITALLKRGHHKLIFNPEHYPYSSKGKHRVLKGRSASPVHVRSTYTSHPIYARSSLICTIHSIHAFILSTT